MNRIVVLFLVGVFLLSATISASVSGLYWQAKDFFTNKLTDAIKQPQHVACSVDGISVEFFPEYSKGAPKNIVYVVRWEEIDMLGNKSQFAKRFPELAPKMERKR